MLKSETLHRLYNVLERGYRYSIEKSCGKELFYKLAGKEDSLRCWDRLAVNHVLSRFACSSHFPRVATTRACFSLNKALCQGCNGNHFSVMWGMAAYKWRRACRRHYSGGICAVRYVEEARPKSGSRLSLSSTFPPSCRPASLPPHDTHLSWVAHVALTYCDRRFFPWSFDER